MLTTKERLDRLHDEAARQYVRFEKRKRQTDTIRKAVNATTATTAVTIGATAATGTPPAITTGLAMLMFLTIATSLFLMDRERDRELWRLSEAWRHHRNEAGRLLARDGVQRSADTPDRIHRETLELERKIAETHSDSLFHEPNPAPPKTPADNPDPAPPTPASENG